jgi:hypothetical protein
MLGVALMPLSAMAATLASGQQYSLPAQQQVDGSLYLAAGTATIGGQVNGDLFAVGGTIAVTGTIDGDAAVFGGTVQLLGPVTGDVRAGGGSLSVNDRIGGDFVVAGGTVHLLPGSAVRGDLIVAGGQVVVDGMVQGSVKMAGGQLTINGIVNGNVSARADQKTILGSGARIGGTVTYAATKGHGPATTNAAFPMRALWAVMAIVTGIKMLAMLGLGVLLIWIWRKPSLELLAQASGSFWPSLGRGFAYAILVPIAAILLLVSFVGSLVGGIVVLAYAMTWMFASVLAGMWLGAWIAKLFTKRSTLRLGWWSGLGGIVLMSFLSLIPFVGWIIVKVLALVIFGVLAHGVQRHLASQ